MRDYPNWVFNLRKPNHPFFSIFFSPSNFRGASSLMASLSNQRNVKAGSIHEKLPIYNVSAAANYTAKKKWQRLVPVLVFLVVIAEIALLGRLDMAKNAALLADSFYQFTSLSSKGLGVGGEVKVGASSHQKSHEANSCEEWLERVDNLNYSRDFQKEPILVSGDEQELKSCPVACQYEIRHKKPDACFGYSGQPGASQVLRSMESSHYYTDNGVDSARRKGYDIVMTTSLSSDVPVGYFSWAEYDIMAPPQPKTEKAIAAAFISNCNARNFRLQALEALEKADVKIDSYGACHRNRDGERVDKVKTLKRYKFSLAFENSNEEDYVTEKFFQSLVAGSVPIVVGAPNIQDFAPSPGSLLHIKDLKDAESVAKTMKYLAENPNAYNQSIRWKFDGPSDSFKALFDMASVHSSCRLCIYLATKIREKEEQNSRFLKRPCNCTRGLQTVHHLYVRERGRFEMQSIFLRSANLTLEALESAVLLKFKSQKHIPVWKQERPKSIRGRDDDELKIYRVYPLGKTQREALYTFRFEGDAQLRTHIEKNPCAKFEVIFV